MRSRHLAESSPCRSDLGPTATLRPTRSSSKDLSRHRTLQSWETRFIAINSRIVASWNLKL